MKIEHTVGLEGLDFGEIGKDERGKMLCVNVSLAKGSTGRNCGENHEADFGPWAYASP